MIMTGIYEICFDNRIGGTIKLIDVFINIYKTEEWQGSIYRLYLFKS